MEVRARVSAVRKRFSPVAERWRPIARKLDARFGRASPLIIGRLLSAALTFAVPLVLSRHLSQHEFGVYKQFFLVGLTVVLVGQLGLSQSLYYFLPRGGEKRGAYVIQCIF